MSLCISSVIWLNCVHSTSISYILLELFILQNFPPLKSITSRDRLSMGFDIL